MQVAELGLRTAAPPAPSLPASHPRPHSLLPKALLSEGLMSREAAEARDRVLATSSVTPEASGTSRGRTGDGVTAKK